MHSRRWATLFFSLFLPVFVAAAQDRPQGHVMTQSEYTAFLDRANHLMEGWEDHVRQIDVSKLNIPDSQAKYVEQAKSMLMAHIWQLEAQVKTERAKPRLWREVAIIDGVDQAAIKYNVFLSLLPQGSMPRDLAKYQMVMVLDAQDLAITLQGHVQMRLDKLEK